MSKFYVLETANLSKTFGDKQVVRNVSFSVERGDVFGFLGPNGAGKTTTIRMMLGLIHTDSGTVKINGYDTKKDFMKAIENVGAIVETPKFHENLTAYQNLALIANLHSNISKSRVNEVLQMVGLEENSKEKVRTFSLGMKQRLGIARALINYPKIIFLDEPTNGLDPQGIKEVRAMISQLAIEHDITFFLTTHLLHEVEQICNKVAILKKGELLTVKPVKELLEKEQESVEIKTKQIEDTTALLKEINYISNFKLNDDGITVELEKGYSGKLNYYLVSNNIKVDYIIPQSQSLEQFFIELTEGGKTNV